MWVIKFRKIFYLISFLLIVLSLASLWFFGLKPGLDFTGGSLLNISFTPALPALEKVEAKVHELGYEGASVRQVGTDSYMIRLREISNEEKTEIIEAVSLDKEFTPELKEFSTVGPVLGQEAIRKSYISIVLVLLAIILFITFAFRKVSLPAGRQGSLPSWVYGGVALIALAHDVIIPAGAFSILGYLRGFEVDTLFVTALLVILGFSVHDTIVVFDRVRENSKRENERGGKKPFEQIVGDSVTETFTRSINTSLTTLLAVVALYIWGPESTRHFSIALMIGLIAGTYSSIFIGSPLLVTIQKWRDGRYQK